MRVAHTGIVCEDAESLRSRYAVDKHHQPIRARFSAYVLGLLRMNESEADDHLANAQPAAVADAVGDTANPATTGAMLGARMRPWTSPTHFGSSDSPMLPTGAMSAPRIGGRSCGPTLTRADRLAMLRGSIRPSTCCARSVATANGRYPGAHRRHQPPPYPVHDRHPLSS